MTGFEPVTFCTQSKRATKLRYIPFNWTTIQLSKLDKTQGMVFSNWLASLNVPLNSLNMKEEITNLTLEVLKEEIVNCLFILYEVYTDTTPTRDGDLPEGSISMTYLNECFLAWTTFTG
ncbi:hypothetical protein GQ457_01G025920 [Hibiscus cannabinus]